ncbi:hypothetical protein C923_03195 [Plasmodium falciparum UGT5.1]|uniref:Plasmodium RESA N-terminal domain-containing protein n=1 Tax=Plasmodium falciparum UGT5.1 TaxID=1237627 RepID=W7JB81_PLAFA|nr:hypothetical protein C923_03195 [Plasmodium falciparum UGT5.1]
MSKQLTESELREILNSFKECPPKEDLRNIWTHTIGIAKEGLDDILKALKELIQKYLDNDIYEWETDEYGNKELLYDRIWHQNLYSLCGTIANEERKYTNRFLNLINDKHILDDILIFIYSFLEHFNTLKKELHIKYKEELLRSIAQTMN